MKSQVFQNVVCWKFTQQAKQSSGSDTSCKLSPCLLRRQFAWSIKSNFLQKIEKYFKTSNLYPVCSVKTAISIIRPVLSFSDDAFFFNISLKLYKKASHWDAITYVFIKKNKKIIRTPWLTLVLLNLDMPCPCNSVDPDKLVSEEANRSRYALFVIQYVNFCINKLDQVIWLADN